MTKSMSKSMSKMINLGCGERFHSDWTNVDMNALNPAIKLVDLRRTLPYGDNEFSIVYHSHILEHFTREDAKHLIAECFRILRAGGTMRVVVPDLENVVREYLHQLSLIDSGVEESERKYQWVIVELLDQLVRVQPGGEMMRYLIQPVVPELDYVVERIGAWPARLNKHQDESAQPTPRADTLTRIKYLLRRIRLFARNYRPWISEVSRNGELHRWMYDRFSLGQLVKEAGFTDIVFVAPAESRIDSWRSYNLDIEPDGSPIHPGSLYLEATKRPR